MSFVTYRSIRRIISTSLTCSRSKPRNRFLSTSTRCYNGKVDGVAKRESKPLYKGDQAKKFKGYIFSRFFEYVGNYQTKLETRFPRAVNAYRIFFLGNKDFFTDMKNYLIIIRLMSSSKQGLAALNRKELELYYHMPREMRKNAPVLLISALPIVIYFVLPIAYYFPKRLLSHHFWTIEQRVQFRTEILQSRLKHNRPVFRALQARLGDLRDHHLYSKWDHILGQLGSGVHPNIDEIICCKELFETGPYNIVNMTGGHIRHLIFMFDLHFGLFRRYRLLDHAKILIAMDRAIVKEGLCNIPHEDLKRMCFMRGLYSSYLSQTEMLEWLDQWMTISNQITSKDSYTLLLHCPILLGYNHPGNWSLIYSNKF